MKDVKLYWMPYKLFPYEKVLGKREAESLLEPKEIQEGKGCLFAIGCRHPEQAENLVYFSAYIFDYTMQFTLQYKREHGNEKKQNTRYYSHGIHEYKGKFNPQIVRSVMNMCKVSNNAVVLDPFCGSGTSLLEIQLQGSKAYGIDINPMATFIARTKTGIVFSYEDIVNFDVDLFVERVLQMPYDKTMVSDTRSDYLRNWFREDIFVFIEKWKKATEDVGNETLRDLLLLSMSNILRDYSEQEPSDLRVRRRKTPYLDEPISEAVKKSFLRSQAKISQFLLISDKKSFEPSCVINGDICTIPTEKLPLFDFAITSPPYATALPYIDTQRLSIVWLGLDTPQNIKTLECSLIGSRETISKTEQDNWIIALSKNSKNLCTPVRDFCQDLQHKLTRVDGFRKQHTPFLLYKYFAEMAQMFETVHQLLKPRAYYCLVVGYNKTSIGGHTIIDTPALLVEEAKTRGYHVEEIIPLETYQRYGLHVKQAISGEVLIILKA